MTATRPANSSIGNNPSDNKPFHHSPPLSQGADRDPQVSHEAGVRLSQVATPANPTTPTDTPTNDWRELYPFSSQELRVGGHRYHYLDEGPADAERTLLCVHGNPTWSFFWREIVKRFRGRFRVVAVDHLGCGLSEKPQSYRYCLAEHITNLLALWDHLQLQKVVLVAHDWGGPIGLGAAVARADAVAGLALMNTACFRDTHIPWSIRVCRWPVLGPCAVRGLNAFARAALRWATASPQGLPAKVQAGLLAPYDCWASRVALLRFVQDIPLDPRSATACKLAEIESQLQVFRDRPVQLLWGMQDFCFTPHFLSRWLGEFFPHADVRRIEAAGHYIVEDAPEEVLQTLEGFLAREQNPRRASANLIQAESLTQRSQPDQATNVASRLVETAMALPNARAVIVPGKRDATNRRQYQVTTFQELDQETDRLARGLRQFGVTPGTRLVLMVRPGLEFVALTFAIFKVGAVAVLIDPGMGLRNLLACLDEVEPEGFLGVPLVQAVRTLLHGRYPQARFNVTVGAQPRLWDGLSWEELRGGPWKGPELEQLEPKAPAAIIFTSGSTGPAKGVLYSHKNFDAQVDEIRQRYNIQPGEVNLPGFPLFTLFDAAMGVTTVIPDMNPSRPAQLDPPKLIEAIHDWHVTQSFGSPAIWEKISRYCQEHRLKLPSLRRVLSAGAPVPPSVLSRLQDCLPAEAQIETPYGATEALPISSISATEVLGETAIQSSLGAGTCVGRRFSQIEWKIIQATDRVIPSLDQAELVSQGNTGEVIVRGPVVTSEYFRKPEVTAASKIQDGESFWHRMGDVGYLDSEERLWFCGRLKQRVMTAEGPLDTEPVEGIFNQHTRVFRSALVGVGEPASQSPVVIVELQRGQPIRGAADRESLLSDLRQLAVSHALTRAIDTFLIHPRFPVDVRHNAKIGREKLSQWAIQKLGLSGSSQDTV